MKIELREANEARMKEWEEKWAAKKKLKEESKKTETDKK